MKDNKKRNIIIFLFVVAVIVVIAIIIGCNNKNNENGTENLQKSYSIGQTINTEKLEFTVLSVDKTKTVTLDNPAKSVFTAKGDKVYYIVNVRIKNLSNDNLSLDTSSFKLENSGIMYSPSILSTDKSINFDGIDPGTEVERKIYFYVPDNVNLSKAVLLPHDNIFSDIGSLKIRLFK